MRVQLGSRAPWRTLPSGSTPWMPFVMPSLATLNADSALAVALATACESQTTIFRARDSYLP